MVDLQSDQYYMQRALALAARAQGYTSPNPLVGAVLVRDGRIVGEGWHQAAGGAHAEVHALQDAGDFARGACAYVTLEPCAHTGRTAPCCEALIAAGVSRVVYAIDDPNPLARGGAEKLRAAGIAVTAGICAQEAREQNRFFLHFVQHQRPYCIAKFAASLDGKIATSSGESQWITGHAARARSHQLRQAVDAIVVGAGTVIADDPSLTVRLPHLAEPCHPLRVILDSRGRVPLSSKVFAPHLPGQTLVVGTAQMPEEHEAALLQRGVPVMRVQANPVSGVCLPALLQALAQPKVAINPVQSLMVEGGATLLGRFLQRDHIDEVWAFLAPILIGGGEAPGIFAGSGRATLAEALRLHKPVIEQLDSDILLRAQVQRSKLSLK